MAAKRIEKGATLSRFIVRECGLMKKTNSKAQSDEYARFEKLAKQLISVPKSEIDKRQAEYEKKKAARKRLEERR